MVAQQFFWSPFIVFCCFCFSPVLIMVITVLIVSVTLESIEILLNNHWLVDTYMLYKRMEKFSPLKLCLIFLWPLNV